jgi:hypothetical protein
MPGSRRAIALSISALLACGCADVLAADGSSKRPLQLQLASAPSTALPLAPLASPASRRRTTDSRGASHFRVAEPSLGERALTSLLDDADKQATASPAAGSESATFRFNRSGNAGRDLARGYNNMCDAVSRKLWDDPNGKRVKFDVAGKPGVAIEIPLR